MRKILLLLITLIVGLAGQTAMATTKTYIFEGQQGNSQVEFTGYFYAEGASSTHYNSTPSPWTYGSTGSLSFTLADGITLTLSSSTNKLIYLTDKGLAAQGEATLTVSGGSSYYIYHVRLLDSNGNVIQLDANGSPVTQGGVSSCDYFNTTKSFTSSYPANNGVVFKKVQISYVTNIANIADDAYQGSGTSNAPYIISSTSDLDLLAKLVNAGNNFSGKFFRQGANITYTHSSNWYDASSTENNYTAIGDEDHHFKGTFDGNNHTISGIRLYKGGGDLPDDCQGLFGKVGQGGTVKRVILSDARITGDNNIGGIAGGTVNATIEDCSVGDNVCIHAVQNNTCYHGGIVGYNQNIVRRCISHATLTIKSGITGCKDFGGIVGNNNVTNGATITDCIALGVTIPNVNGHGAIVGYQNNNNNLTRNYYYNCIVGSNVTPSGVGKGNSESSTETSDVDGAQALYAITLGPKVTLNRSAEATLPGTNNKTYTNGADINGQPYAYATATVSLGYTGNVPEGMAPVYSANGATISGNTLTMPAAPVTISATLAAVHYDITLSESIDHGTVTCDKATATMGETVTLTVTPDAGYAFGTLTVMNGDTPVATTAGENGTYTFTMPAAPVTVTATFISEKEITVHDGTDYNYYIPVYGFGTNYYQKQEIIYPAAELAEINGLYITQLTYYLQSQADREWAGAQFKVYMREVEQTDYSGGATFLGFDEGDIVYEGPLSGTAPTMVIPLDNPYLYNGGNLLVGVYLPTKGTYSSTTFYGETTAKAAVRGYSSSSFDGLTATIENFRPKTTFYSQVVTMPRPTQVTADNINATGAIVGWTENGGATAWQLCVDDDEEHLIDTNDNPCTLTGLEPNAEHTVRVRSVDGVAHSIWSAPVTFTTLELVNKPADLTVQLTPGDGTIATLSWTECGNATSWQVSLNGDEENPISANENPFTLTGLTPETRYTARVRALDGNGNHSSWSDPVTFTPFNSLTYLVHDGEVSNQSVPVNGYDVEWFQKCESIYPARELTTIDGYYITQLTYYLQLQADQEWAGAQFKVYMREVEQADYSGGATFLGFDEGDLVYEGPLSGTAPTMVIPFEKAYHYQGGNLLVGVYLPTTGAYSETSFYGETIANASVKGSSSYSFDNIPAFNYNFLPKIAFGLSNFSIIDVTTTTASLSLINPGSATAWQVCLNGDEQNPIDVTENPFTLTGLTPDTEYTVQLRGNYSDGFSAWSVPHPFTTLELVNKPADLTVTIDPDEPTTAILSWTERGSATAWQLCLNGDEENLIDMTTNPYTLKNLTLETEYTACVRALDGNGNHSGWSNTVTFVTILELTVHDVSEPDYNEYIPVCGWYTDWYQKSECIYPAAELASMTDADITQLTYYLAGQADEEWTGARFKVYLREVEQTEYGEFCYNFLGFDEGDLVYEGELSGTAPTMVIPFDTPYTYHGGNLLVGIYEVQTGNYSPAYFLGEQVRTISSVIGYGYSSLDAVGINEFLHFLPKTTFSYLKEMGVPGDVNGDGFVTSSDVTVLYDYLLTGDTSNLKNGDVNGDGFVTSADVTAVYDILLGN